MQTQKSAWFMYLEMKIYSKSLLLVMQLKIKEKLGTWFIDEYETQYVELKDLPDMINVVNKEISNPLNKDILLYLKNAEI